VKGLRSLTLLLSIQIIISCGAVIAVNRMVAKHFVTMDVYQGVELEMKTGMAACADRIGMRPDFLTCYRKTNTLNASRYLSDALHICNVVGSNPDKEEIKLCEQVVPTQVKWLSKGQPDSFLERFFTTTDSRAEWTGVKLDLTPGSAYILLNKNETAHFLDRLWGYRDSTLLLVLPFIVFLCGLVALLAIRLMMVPIASLEKSLIDLSADNLHPSDVAYSKYREFDGLTKIYRDLQVRLDESFRKARNFTAYASHELKTPLTIMRGGAQRLIAELPVGSAVQVHASQVGEEVERLIEITDKLLLLSRADAKALVTQREDFDLSSFLETFAEDAAAFQENLQIETDIAPGVVWRCDPVLIKQLVHNLYTNAVKYNVAGGHISFALRRAGDTLTLTLRNTSANVSQEVADHAFDRFYRGDPSHSRRVDGLGLGLSICQEIAKVHQGTLRFVLLDPQTVAMNLTVPLNF